MYVPLVFLHKLTCTHNCNLYSSSSGACLRRRSRCHEFPPSRSILSASLCSRQSKIHRLQVGLHGSEPGLPWTTNPLSPVVRWARNAGLESSVMILSRVSSVEMLLGRNDSLNNEQPISSYYMYGKAKTESFNLIGHQNPTTTKYLVIM